MQLDPVFLEQYRDRQPPFDDLGLVTFLRTYSAHGRETWFDVCKRVVEGAWTIGERYNPRGMDDDHVRKWSELMFDHMFNLRWIPAGRGLQHMGHDRMWTKGSGVLQNCGFIDSADDNWIAFLANMSMLGVGVGFDMSGAGKHTLRTPVITGHTTVADTREGWVAAFADLYKALITPGATAPQVIDLSCLRPKGAPLATMGGVSSGPDPLGNAIVNFCTASGVLAATYDAGKQLVHVAPGPQAAAELTSDRILDFGNIVGVCVVSGGIRRSAEIAIFEPDDDIVFNAKRDTTKLYAWRWASNNTIRYTAPPSRDEIRKVVQNCHDFGDPGMLFLYNVLGKGRTGDVNVRERGHGCNPCVTGDTLIPTTQGLRRVEDLIGQPFAFAHQGTVWQSSADGFWKTKDTDTVVRVQTSDGTTVECTPDHKVMTIRGPVEAENLCVGDKVVRHASDMTNFEVLVAGDIEQVRRGWAAGNFYGDGHMLTSKRKPACLEFWGEGRNIYGPTVSSWFTDAKVQDVPSRNKIGVYSALLDKDLRDVYGFDVNKNVDPSKITSLCIAEQFAFVLGLLEADGSFQGTATDKGLSIRITSVDPVVLNTAKGILAACGIASQVYSGRKKAGLRSFGTQEYNTKELHELVVTSESRRALAALILDFCKRHGLPTRYEAVARQFVNAGCYKQAVTTKVLNVTKVQHKEPVAVYDCSIPGLNYFPAGGIMIANCGEQPLESTELCNLVEICLPRCADYTQFEQVTLCALYYGKLVTMLPVGVPDTDAIMRRNRRIGVSVTGFVECMDRAAWFTDAYSTMRKFDQRVSRRHNIAESVKITSVKPSGTVSLVLGCSPGMNPHFAPHYIRRINIEDTSPLCAMLDAAGYPHARNVYSKTSYVYEFPMRASGPTAFTAVEQLQNVLTLQANWSDNMVSNTIVFDESEIDDIADFVFANRDKFKSLAFLKREHGFEQAPLEEITANDYAARVAALRPLDLSILHGADTHDTDERGCESGKCEIVFGGE